MDRRTQSIIFAMLVGALVFYLSYRWITNPEGREERLVEIGVVEASRVHLAAVIGRETLEFVDPLSPNRKIGKVYVFAEGEGWSVSGFYRRDDSDSWHPYLMSMKPDLSLVTLKLKDDDAELIARAAGNPALEISP